MSPTLASPDEARALLSRGAAVLDARSTPRFLAGHLPGAAPVSWRIGVPGGLRSGLLGDPGALAAGLAALGVREDAPVLVVGDWTDGWGEEARIAWNLAYLGHPEVAVLAGGAGAWPGPWRYGPARARPGRLSARPRPELRATREQLLPAGALLVDVREPDEFAGSNAHLAAYGGHIPGAVNLPWRALQDAPEPLPRDRLIIPYCTGGVRSAMAWLWLHARGYRAAHYEGGWWDWSAAHPR